MKRNPESGIWNGRMKKNPESGILNGGMRGEREKREVLNEMMERVWWKGAILEAGLYR